MGKLGVGGNYIYEKNSYYQVVSGDEWVGTDSKWVFPLTTQWALPLTTAPPPGHTVFGYFITSVMYIQKIVYNNPMTMKMDMKMFFNIFTFSHFNTYAPEKT